MLPSTHNAPKTVHNPHISSASLKFSPLELNSTFPLEMILDGERDDRAIKHLHIHDALEVGYCLQGTGTYYIGSKILPFHAGDVTVITHREYHRSRSSPGTRSRWAWFFLEPQRLLVPHVTPVLTWEPERFSGTEFTNVLRPAAHPAITQIVQQLYAEAQHSDSHSRPNLRALCLVLLNNLHRRFPKPRRKSHADHSTRALARIAPALQIIADQYHEPLTIPNLASACAMSVRNFQLHFTKLMGCSPQSHLLRSRIQAAAALLADESRAITEIAFSCGFNTLSSFNRAFKAAHRLSPRGYRLAQRHQVSDH